MRVLFLHDNQPEYLAEGLFHGLRSLLGRDCVDVPRYDSMYAPLTNHLKSKQRGNAFTLYGLLDDIPDLAGLRSSWKRDLAYYDLIIIGNIWLQSSLYWELSSILDPMKLAILDGSDYPFFFPYASLGWRLRNNPRSYFTPVRRSKYFKRELIGGTSVYSLDRFLPAFTKKWNYIPKNATPISFSIPAEKIYHARGETRLKDFPLHIVDPDVASHIKRAFFSEVGSDKYIFSSEEGYYGDLRNSRYGITMKRAGWDCLRHYELAANGCVLCFKDLDLKPDTCAPHGLSKSNCIIYHSYEELKDRISSISESEYHNLQGETYEWIKKNTTLARAQEFLNKYASNFVGQLGSNLQRSKMS